MWWTERLEQLRREQNPSRYDPQRPHLQLPVPPSPQRAPELVREDPEDEDPHVIEFDL